MPVFINIDVPALAPAIVFYTTGLGLTLGRHLGADVVERVASTPGTRGKMKRDPRTG